MRDYGRISPEFWTGITGRELRGCKDAQIVGLYIITAPAANMIGVFNCPLWLIAADTGLSPDDVNIGMARLIKANFLTYSKKHELMWVHEMARFQIAPSLAPTDKRVIGIRRYVEKIQDPSIKTRFFKKYQAAFHLIASPLQAPSKPLQASPLQAPPKPLSPSPLQAPPKPRTRTRAIEHPPSQGMNLLAVNRDHGSRERGDTSDQITQAFPARRTNLGIAK